MGLFKGIFEGRSQKRRRAPKRKQTPEDITMNVRSTIVNSALKSLNTHDRAEYGKMIIAQIVGAESDPDKMMLNQELGANPELRREYIELLIEEKRAGIAAKLGNHRRRRRDDDDDDDDRMPYGGGGDQSPFGVFDGVAQELLMERLMGGEKKESGTDFVALIKAAATVLAPILLGQMSQSQQQAGGLLPGMQPAPAPAQPVISEVRNPAMAPAPAREPAPAPTPEAPAPAPNPTGNLLFGAITPQRMEELLLMAQNSNAEQAATLLLQDCAQVAASMSDAEKVKVSNMVHLMVQVGHDQAMMLLSSYKTDQQWEPIIIFLEQHPEVFDALQSALAIKLDYEDEDDEPEDGDDLSARAS